MEITKTVCPSDKGTILAVTGVSLPEVSIQINLVAKGWQVTIFYFGKKMANYYYSADNFKKLAGEMARDINLIFYLRGKNISTSDEQILLIIEGVGTMCDINTDPVKIIFNQN